MTYYQLTFYVPEDAAEAVKQAVFSAGAGRVGEYDCCAWQTLGQGQFRPLDAANPAIGKINELTYVSEFKIEMVCEEAFITKAISALKASHPYEEPAYSVVKLVT